jgi:hypothetical protein
MHPGNPRSLRAGLAALALAASLLTAASAPVFAGPAPRAPSAVTPAASAWFSSPSRNIGCMMDTSSVRCDVISYSYHPPAKPASCHFAWGPSVGVGTTGKGRFRCVSDTVAGAPTILKYGKSRTVGRYTCTSRSTGMTCINTRTGHGFRIARTNYSLF